MIHRLIGWVMWKFEDRWFQHLVDCEQCLPPVQPGPDFDDRVLAALHALGRGDQAMTNR